MNVKKGLVLLSVLFAILIAGCGKKGQTTSISDKASEKNVSVVENIPVVNEEVEDFFDDEAISEFAFLDEDFNKEEKKDEEEKAENSLAKNETQDLDFSEDFFEEDEFKEDEAFVSWDEDGIEQDITFKTVNFDLNKNEIRKDQQDKIKENIELAKTAVSEGKTVVVQGHCCQEGPPSFNIALSKQRAETIKKEMIKNGISEDKIKTVGCGQEMPVVWSDKTNKKERLKELAPNRRSEILIES